MKEDKIKTNNVSENTEQNQQEEEKLIHILFSSENEEELKREFEGEEQLKSVTPFQTNLYSTIRANK